MAPTQLSIVLEGLLNELGTADLSTLEAMLKHDTGAVLDAIRSTAAAAEAGAAAYASSATSNVVVCRSSTATAGAISVQHEGSISRTLVSTDAQTTLKGSDIHAAASSATAEMLLRQELEEKLRSQTKELASEQRSANAMKRALASARDELAAAQELRRSDSDNLRTAQQAAKRDIKAAERMADEAKPWLGGGPDPAVPGDESGQCTQERSKTKRIFVGARRPCGVSCVWGGARAPRALPGARRAFQFTLYE